MNQAAIDPRDARAPRPGHAPATPPPLPVTQPDPNTPNADAVRRLRALKFCEQAVAWAEADGGSARQLWERCDRGDWMIWLVEGLGVDRRLIVRAACACARLALPYVPGDETRPLAAIDTAEAWARGEAMLEQVQEAVSPAFVVASDEAYGKGWSAFAYAAHAAFNAGYCATADVYYAAYNAVDFVAAAARAAAAAGDHAAGPDPDEKKAWAACARVIREIVPFSDVLQLFLTTDPAFWQERNANWPG